MTPHGIHVYPDLPTRAEKRLHFQLFAGPFGKYRMKPRHRIFKKTIAEVNDSQFFSRTRKTHQAKCYTYYPPDPPIYGNYPVHPPIHGKGPFGDYREEIPCFLATPVSFDFAKTNNRPSRNGEPGGSFKPFPNPKNHTKCLGLWQCARHRFVVPPPKNTISGNILAEWKCALVRPAKAVVEGTYLQRIEPEGSSMVPEASGPAPLPASCTTAWEMGFRR